MATNNLAGKTRGRLFPPHFSLLTLGPTSIGEAARGKELVFGGSVAGIQRIRRWELVATSR